MTNGPTYVLDADVFMTAARLYYAFDIVPHFWRALVEQASNGRLISIDRVKMDIDRGNDELKQWANSSFHQWFSSTNQDGVVRAYGSIMQWAQNQEQFTNAAKAEFANSSDGWLVACAKANNHTVVTNETYDARIRRRIKIPNVCRAFGVPYIDPFQMLRALSITLG